MNHYGQIFCFRHNCKSQDDAGVAMNTQQIIQEPVAVLRRGPEGAMAPPEGGNNNLGAAQISFMKLKNYWRLDNDSLIYLYFDCLGNL